MKKLGPINPDIENWDLLLLACGKIDDLIDLVNSQQEAIEKLESKVWTAGFIEKYRPALENLADDTHRTVTLRIPKGMTFVEALFYADLSLNMSDNQAKKALDEVQPNE